MGKPKLPMPTSHSHRRPIHLGFIALSDAAPIIVAQEHGLFTRRGLEVALRREVGWATLRDKVIYGDLDVAHGLAGMLVATQLGLGCPASDVMTACVLSENGNAITLSRTLWDAGARDAASLRAEVRRRHGERRLTFGVVFPWSSHHLMLREWLRAGGLEPDRDVRVVVVPPAQMFRNLAAGTIDGFCAGEPWNSLCVQQNAGVVAACSVSQDMGHMEKVLMASARFAAARREEHVALVSALIEACAWCDEPQNRPELLPLLARPEYLNVPEAVLAPALTGPFDCGGGRPAPGTEFVRFAREETNVPSPARGAALIRRMAAAGLIPTAAADDANLARRLFREDIYRHALTHLQTA
jgi:ABC-type nitrate/sulfonate/bicarbonate transport system substrate-binding protein